MSPCKKSKTKPAAKYPGTAIDNADNEKVDRQDVEERTKTLGYNPRNSK